MNYLTAWKIDSSFMDCTPFSVVNDTQVRQKEMKVFAFIQARMGSSRFPGKVLMPILGKPMIEWQLERLRLSKKITDILLLTSTSPSDDPLEEYCTKQQKIPFFRGSENNVLNRFYEASLEFIPPTDRNKTLLIRLTGDCPLTDPFLLDEALNQFISKIPGGCRYFGYDTDLPDGLDFEMFTWEALRETHENATDPFEKEHVTPLMWRNPDRFQVQRFSMKGITPGLRFSVDYAEDLDLVQEILRIQEKTKKFLGIREINALLSSNAELRALNSKIIKNEGLIQSALASDSLHPHYGIALESEQKPTEDLLEWALRMGIKNWLIQEPARSRLLSFIEKSSPSLKTKIWTGDTTPPSWVVFNPAKNDEKELVRLVSQKDIQGIFLQITNRVELAKALTFLCHTRFL